MCLANVLTGFGLLSYRSPFLPLVFALKRLFISSDFRYHK